jgi:beta-galactosidase
VNRRHFAPPCLNRLKAAVNSCRNLLARIAPSPAALLASSAETSRSPQASASGTAWFVGLLVLCSVAASAAFAQRQTQALAEGWRFIREDAPLAAATDAWTAVTIPHTWNALDGQDGRTPGATPRANERGSDYHRGLGWYARNLDLPEAWRGRRVFVLFEAASQRAVVYLNGERIGEHRGGFTAFCFELTPHVRFGAPNELRVQVDNTLDKTIPPLAGDFNVDGGIYRPVHLVVTDATCISPLESASPGVFATVRRLRDRTAEIEVKTLLASALAAAADVEVATEIKDADNAVVAAARSGASLAGGAAAQPVGQSLVLREAHLWQGRRDPYLYSVTVQLLRAGRVVDEVTQPLGVRTVALTSDGFLLNGQPYPVYGVNRHQDLKDHGWALTPADEARDMQFIVEIGAIAVRLAHYPQSENIHALADRAGLLLWNEVPFVNNVPDEAEPPDAPSATTQAFNATLETEMREMILQRSNHPSVAWWGLFNELRPGATNLAALPEVRRLNALAHELDPTRPTVAASDKLANPTNAVPDAMAYNVYPGWYTGAGEAGEMAKLIDERFADRGRQRVALSEYGAGGNPAQHQEGPPTKPKANNGPVHPEEWQALMHERGWAQIRENPKLWGSFVWVMFDFASDGRSEGGVPGINDKGLVTQDRQVKKDAYYFYQANWSDTRMVYIASRRATLRHQAGTEIKVYSNCAEVELRVNDRSLGVVKPDELRIARWPGVLLQPGKNLVRAVVRDSGREISDTCEWILAP